MTEADHSAILALANQFGCSEAQVVEEPSVDPHFHRVIHCRAESADIALKVLSLRPDLPAWLGRFVDSYRVETQLLDRGAWYVPRPLLTERGEPIASTQDSSGNSLRAVAHEWVHGDVLGSAPHDLAHGYESIAVALAHMLATPAFPTASRRVAGNGDLTLIRHEEVLATLSSRGLVNVSRHEGRLMFDATHTRADPMGVGHRDLRSSNVIVSRTTQLVSLIDFENAGPSRPEWEVSRLLVDLWARGLDDESEGRIESLILDASGCRDSPDLDDFGDWLSGFILYLEYLVGIGDSAALRSGVQVFNAFLHGARRRSLL